MALVRDSSAQLYTFDLFGCNAAYISPSRAPSKAHLCTKMCSCNNTSRKHLAIDVYVVYPETVRVIEPMHLDGCRRCIVDSSVFLPPKYRAIGRKRRSVARHRHPKGNNADAVIAGDCWRTLRQRLPLCPRSSSRPQCARWSSHSSICLGTPQQLQNTNASRNGFLRFRLHRRRSPRGIRYDCRRSRVHAPASGCVQGWPHQLRVD